MSKIVQTPEITEGWMHDQNKFYLFRKKDFASWAVGEALAQPTPANVRNAFGRVSDYSSYLVHGALGRNKVELERDANYVRLRLIRQNISEICSILYGSPESPDTQAAFRKFGVRRGIVRRGIYKTEAFSNIALLAIKLQESLFELNEYAQQAGFGSAKAIAKVTGRDKLLVECGLDEDDIVDIDDDSADIDTEDE